MPRKRERLSRAGWADDPLVPIRVERLRALLDRYGWGPSELAGRVGRTQQTISALLRPTGEATRTCRQSLRTKIARALDAPEELLAGEEIVLPGGPFDMPGFEYRYSDHTILATSRLLTKARAACERDLQGCAASGSLPPWPPPPVVINQLLSDLCDLIRIKDWRIRLIQWNRGVEEARGYTEPATLDPWRVDEEDLRRRAEALLQKNAGRVAAGALFAPPKPAPDPNHEAAVLGLVSALEHVTQPWMNGDAGLSYRGLHLLVFPSAKPTLEGPPVPDTHPYAAYLPLLKSG